MGTARKKTCRVGITGLGSTTGADLVDCAFSSTGYLDDEENVSDALEALDTAIGDAVTETAALVTAEVTIALGSSSGTATVAAALDGKPVVGAIPTALDATGLAVTSASISGTTLTVTVEANATAEMTINCLIDAR